MKESKRLVGISIDQDLVKEILLEEVKKKIEAFDADLIFMNTKELKRRTSMSWNTIQKTFFFDSRFPKYKIGGRWMFPAQKKQRTFF